LETLTYPDIIAFITSRFRESARFLELEEEEPDFANQLIKDIANKASGIILWVLLVVRSLLEVLKR
jgi:hypothetical protein